MIKEIRKWQTSDGQEFAEKADAAMHEGKLKLTSLLLTQYTPRGRASDKAKAREDLLGFMTKHADALHQLLGDMLGKNG